MSNARTIADLGGVTSTSAELNILDGVTATTAEVNYLDITTLGTSEASKTLTADSNGVVTFDNGTIEESTALSGTAVTINLRDGDNFTHTLSGNTTYTFSNPAASGKTSSFTLKVTQDSTARTITWPAAVKWAGGSGQAVSITGSSVAYGGGGGGGAYTGSGGTGGSGGGGTGGDRTNVATAGTDGLGGGGGGGGHGNSAREAGGAGGDGTVIIRSLKTASSTTGSPTLTTDGSYKIYKFTSNGTITF